MARQPRRIRWLLATLASAALCVIGCGGDDADRAAPERTAPTPSARVPALCRRLDVRVSGQVADRSLDELSGLARSRTQPGVYWAQQDSGSAAELVALRADGRVLARVAVTGADAVDWEDVSVGGTREEPWLYVADIGDNDGVRDTIDVYRVREPSLADQRTSATAERLRLRYPDGPHDAEALLADDRTGELVVVTKSLEGARAYGAPNRWAGVGEVTLRRGPAIALGLVTAGDVSADGRVVALRSYAALAVWTRRPGEPLLSALARDPCRPPTLLLEGQGESLALDAAGNSALTVTEGTSAALRRYAPAAR